MILDMTIASKDIGNKHLLKDSNLSLSKGEKVALIGANGTGKSTLIRIICGLDNDYDGQCSIQKGVNVVWGRQEHTEHNKVSVIDYILSDLPEYSSLHKTIEGFAQLEQPHPAQLQAYSDAIERFTALGYFEIENSLQASFNAYQLDNGLLNAELGTLSGGQKRLVELIKLQQSHAGLLVFDEPTNHMDYIAKNTFISWLKQTKSAVLLVSHDRDVLESVERIVELRDYQLHSYKGNYSQYLKTHTVKITGSVHEYEVTQKRIANLKDDVIRYDRLKQKARHPGTIKRFKNLEERSRTELANLQKLEKPTFWIDKEASSELKSSVKDVYNKHKTKTISIQTHKAATTTDQSLVKLDVMSLGYQQPLFSDVSFELRKGDRLHISGRNGAGKTTLFEAIIATSTNRQPRSTVFAGSIELHKEVRLGVYEQEIPASMLQLTLGEAVEEVYRLHGLALNETAIKSELQKYLFNAHSDYGLSVAHLSGGQKARLQLIRMLAGKPNVLLLDEPTNHLDLPSIEELEQAVTGFEGAVLYISHDSYFTANVGGNTVTI